MFDPVPPLLSQRATVRLNSGEVKWSGKFGQRARMYPTRTLGYENDKTTELFRPV